MKLDEIEKENYVLTVDSLEPSVVELPPIQNSKYPRIIAVTEGGGPIMRWVLFPSLSKKKLCMLRRRFVSINLSIVYVQKV